MENSEINTRLTSALEDTFSALEDLIGRIEGTKKMAELGETTICVKSLSAMNEDIKHLLDGGSIVHISNTASQRSTCVKKRVGYH